MRHLANVILAASLAFCATQAHASAVTRTYSFNLGGFVPLLLGGTPSPVASVSGSFTVTFDPTVSTTNNEVDLVVNAFSGPTVSTALAFSYDASYKFLSFGGLAYGTNRITGGSDDFVLLLLLNDIDAPALVACDNPEVSCGPLHGNAAYALSGFSSSAASTDVWIATLEQSSVSVPEPGTLALVAFGALGALASRRRVGAQAVAWLRPGRLIAGAKPRRQRLAP